MQDDQAWIVGGPFGTAKRTSPQPGHGAGIGGGDRWSEHTTIEGRGAAQPETGRVVGGAFSAWTGCQTDGGETGGCSGEVNALAVGRRGAGRTLQRWPRFSCRPQAGSRRSGQTSATRRWGPAAAVWPSAVGAFWLGIDKQVARSWLVGVWRAVVASPRPGSSPQRPGASAARRRGLAAAILEGRLA